MCVFLLRICVLQRQQDVGAYPTPRRAKSGASRLSAFHSTSTIPGMSNVQPAMCTTGSQDTHKCHLWSVPVQKPNCIDEAAKSKIRLCRTNKRHKAAQCMKIDTTCERGTQGYNRDHTVASSKGVRAPNLRLKRVPPPRRLVAAGDGQIPRAIESGRLQQSSAVQHTAKEKQVSKTESESERTRKKEKRAQST